MKRSVPVAAFFITLIGMISGAIFMSNASGPNIAVAGSPLENNRTCANPGCHGGVANTGPGNVLITGISEYEPGETYQLTFTVNNPGRSEFGFQAISLNTNNQPSGSWAPVAGLKSISANGANYIGHSTPSSTGTWVVDWTAPATDAGDIVFYMAGNATNNNGGPSGDNIYSTALQIPRQANTDTTVTSVNTPDDLADNIRMFPNPALDFVTIESSNTVNVSLIDVQGKILQSSVIKADERKTINVSAFPAGIYLVGISGEGNNQWQRLVVTK